VALLEPCLAQARDSIIAAFGCHLDITISIFSPRMVQGGGDQRQLHIITLLRTRGTPKIQSIGKVFWREILHSAYLDPGPL